MKTRDRIILASLDLFNERGERNVTTNHIAAHLGMSPGNLYYHFRNKSDIIYEIFKSYEMLVDTYLSAPEGSTIGLQELVKYLDATFNGLWAYRFLHQDLEHLIDSDERLREEYRAFTVRCLRSIEDIIRAMELSGLYLPQTEQGRQDKALNTWLLVTNWMTYLKSIVHSDSARTNLGRDVLNHGIYMIVDYVMPYIVEDKKSEMEALRAPYFCESLSLRPFGPV